MAPRLDGFRGSSITSTSGTYRLLVSGFGPPSDESATRAFWVGVSKPGYNGDSKELSFHDPACTWDNSTCDVVANFTLTPE